MIDERMTDEREADAQGKIDEKRRKSTALH